MNIKEFFEQRKARKLFPRWKRDFWYCGEFNEYQHRVMKEGKPWHEADLDLPTDVFLINPFWKYSEIREGGVLPCIKMDGYIGYYEIKKKWRDTSSDDFLPWDDGYKVNLELHHIEPAPVKEPKPVLVSDCEKLNGVHKRMWYCVGVAPGSYCTVGKAQFGECPFRVYKRTYNKTQQVAA